MLSAGEFCHRSVVIASPAERVVDIARRMRDFHVGSVVVAEESEHGRTPIGILTDRDIVVGLVAVEPSYLDRAVVRDLQGGKLITVREDADLYEVMVRMRSYGVRRVPVVNAKGILQGIIAFDDLLDHIAEELHRLSALLQRESDKERRQRPSLGSEHS